MVCAKRGFSYKCSSVHGGQMVFSFLSVDQAQQYDTQERTGFVSKFAVVALPILPVSPLSILYMPSFYQN